MFRGWYVVGGTFLIAVWSWGLGFYGLGIYLVDLSGERGWSISLVSVAITVYFLMGAAATATIGDVMRRFGGHRTVAGGVVAMAVGVACLGASDQLWQLYASLAAMAIGWACTTGAAINILLAPWFERRRGVAVSLALTGASGGGVIIAPALLALIAYFGFAVALRIAAFAMVAMLVPVTLLLLRRTPAELGLNPDGDVAPPAGSATPYARDRAPLMAPLMPVTPARGRSEALRTQRYWTISIAFALGLAAQVGVLTHMVAHLTPLLGSTGAGGALSLTTAAAIAGRVPMGALADRMDRRTIAGLNFLLQVVGIVLLAFASSSVLIYSGCLLFGLGVGNVITLPGLLIEREFSREQFAPLVSLVTATNQVAFAFAPGLIGIVRDATGNYGSSLVLCAVADLIAAVVVLLGRPRNEVRRITE